MEDAGLPESLWTAASVPLTGIMLEGGASLSLRLFGSFDARLAGEPLPALRSRREAWLLGFLALRTGRAFDRRMLAGTFWPESPEEKALANLRRTLTALRRALGAEGARLGAPTPRSVTLDLSGAFVDVLEFDAAIRRGDPPSLARAVALYAGSLLEGCEELWVLPERQARGEALIGALEALAGRAVGRNELPLAERYLRRVINLDPLRESAHRALMEALTARGDTAAALLLYRELRSRLLRDLNTEPDAATTSLFTHLLSAPRPTPPALPTTPAPIRNPQSAIRNPPSPVLSPGWSAAMLPSTSSVAGSAASVW